MITSLDAYSEVMSRGLVKNAISVPLETALGKILGEDIYADLDQPPFHRVAMDGIAINSNQLSLNRKFKILKTVMAGSESPRLPEGPVCFEIMTGAVLPPGADMVIRYEDLHIENELAELQCDVKNLTTNFHIQGSDYRAGDKVLRAGTKIKSTTTAILASVGCSLVKIMGAPRITILSTGDELVEIEEKPSPHQIRWSNGISLQQELMSFSLSDVRIKKLNDDEEQIRTAMQEALASSDVLLLTGGVSAGKYDFVPKLLKECDVKEIFHKVAQRPGKPLWFGEAAERTLVFGLPGNPVSCLVNLRKYVIPLLQYSQTKTMPALPKAVLSEDVGFNKNMTYYCLVKISHAGAELHATPIKGNGSGDFYQLRDSDGFIELRPADAPFLAGNEYDVFLWGI